MRRFDTINQFNTFNKNENRHPLVNVVDLSKADPRKYDRFYYGFYAVFLKEVKCGDLRYGCNYYDYEEGTIVCMAPGQVVNIETTGEETYQPKGLVLAFHPDFIKGTNLGREIGKYTFFSYKFHEALHMSERERKVIMDCLAKIDFELDHPIDKHSRGLIINNIELLLNYCVRFYERQFITREDANKGILERFETLLNQYYTSGKPQLLGLPTVAWSADQLNLSPNYFGDLIKKETGRSAHDYIQSKIMDVAKERIFDLSKSISEIGYELGYKYPQHFTRSFKQAVGVTPNEYRSMN